MKLNKLTMIMAFSMGLAGAANAASTPGGTGTVTFNGEIVDAPCAIAPDKSDQSVDMGTIMVKSIENGGRSSNVGFTIPLESCDAAATKASISFDGVRAEQGNDSLLMMNGSAKGAGVGIVTAKGSDLELGTVTELQDLNVGDNTLNFTAYVQGLGASVTAGNFSSTANFTMFYN